MRDTVLKNKVKSNYITVSREIYKDRRLRLQDRGLIATLLSLSDNWDFNIRGLSSILPDGRDSIEKSLKRLEEMGYVTITKGRSAKGKFTGTTITVNEIPFVKPCPEKPDTDKSDTGNPEPDNPPQYKNNRYKDINEYKNIKNKQSVNSFNRFNQRTYDYDALEREALEFA